MLDRTVAAVIASRELLASEDPDAAAVVRRWVRAACASGLDVAVVGGRDAGTVAAALRVRPQGPGRLLLCPDGGRQLFQLGSTGPAQLPASGSDGSAVRTVLDHLASRGVGPALVLVVGLGDDAGEMDEMPAPLTVGSGIILADLLQEQVRRRRRRRVPDVDPDPAWTVRETGRDPLRHRVTETLFTLGAGGLATRGSVEEGGAGSIPMVLADGVYYGLRSTQQLLPGPDWTGLEVVPPPAEDVRILDLRTGVLLRVESATERPLRTLRLASVTRPGLVALRAEAGVDRLRPGQPLRRPPRTAWAQGDAADRRWAITAAEAEEEAGGGIAAVACQRTETDGVIRTVERLACYLAHGDRYPDPDDAAARLAQAQRAGFEALLAEQRAAWAARWEAVDVRIPDDPAAQLAVRFALFQLWCNVGRSGESAVGARGLSGPGYRGHVFWDADVFVLPAVVSMQPSLARAMLGYRLRRLGAARRAAQAAGRHGARFPWESARSGDDVTPSTGALGAQPIPILTGRIEEHITADVAWAAAHYAEWTGDHAYLRGPARPLLTETARYWASRCRLDSSGHAHIDGVIGPDEYHEDVDDNAYTNVMARWNLRAAADLAGTPVSPLGDGESGSAVDPGEARAWRDLAARLVDGYDPVTSCYEQFRGYHRLQRLLVADVARPPVAADVLLGRGRVAASQLIKQPDVLMLHHLVPDEVAPGSLAANLDLYGPRTAHGSSLSPAIMALLLARAERADEALEMLRVALALDLDDLTGMTASGLHLATLGGVWQAMLAGFAGVRVHGGVLGIDPRLPAAWGSLELRFRCLGRAVRLAVRPDEVRVRTDGPLPVRLAGRDVTRVRREGIFEVVRTA